MCTLRIYSTHLVELYPSGEQGEHNPLLPLFQHCSLLRSVFSQKQLTLEQLQSSTSSNPCSTVARAQELLLVRHRETLIPHLSDPLMPVYTMGDLQAHITELG